MFLCIDDSVSLRLKEPGDDSFIVNAWADSAFYPVLRTLPFFKGNKRVLKNQLRALVRKTLDDKLFVVACSPEFKDLIIGFACFENAGDIPLIHYVYVKEKYRRLGVASVMVKACGVSDKMIISSWSPHAEKICKKKPGMVVHCDSLALFGIGPYLED